MRTLLTIISITLFAALAAAPAWAGTKVKSSLVPTTNGTVQEDTDGDGIPETVNVPTISSKSKFLIKSSGLMKGVIKDIKDGDGNLVTTDGSYKASGTLTGDEYVIVLGGEFFAMNVPYDFVLAVEAKKGKGVAKLNGSSMFSLIPEGIHRASSVNGVRVYGPIGTENVDGCQGMIDANGTHLYPQTTPNYCIGQAAGDPYPTAATVRQIGAGGLLID